MNLVIRTSRNWLVGILIGFVAMGPLLPSQVFAALSVNTVIEVRTTGSDTNGGGFVAGASGTDWSQQDATQYSVTDGVTAGTTTITSATANFGTDVVGNIMYVQGGTGSVAAGWYQITARTNSTTITVDRSTGLTAGTGVTLKIGGALASPGAAAAIVVAGNAVHVKSGTYTVTSASTNISGGCVNSAASLWAGYGSSRLDWGAKPVIKADGVITTFTLFAFSANVATIANIELDGNSRSSSRGFSNATFQTLAYRCNFKNCTNNGSSATTNAKFVQCYYTGNSTATAASTGHFVNCVASGNSITAFSTGNGGTIYGSIADSNTGASTDGILGGTASVIRNCVARSNGRHGISCSGNDQVENNITYGNSGTGLVGSTTVSINNASGGNGTDFNHSTALRAVTINPITLTADPFVDAAGGNFALNTTAGGGASLRAAGIPGPFPGISTTGYGDIGPVQHQEVIPGQIIGN